MNFIYLRHLIGLKALVKLDVQFQQNYQEEREKEQMEIESVKTTEDSQQEINPKKNQTGEELKIIKTPKTSIKVEELEKIISQKKASKPVSNGNKRI